MSVRAKFTVTEIRQRHQWGGRTIILQPVYDTSIPEDQRFYDATPSGSMEMMVNNPAAIERLALGASFYVDFTPVVPAEPAS